MVIGIGNIIALSKKFSGLASIKESHIFADNTARDAYFVLHPEELENNMFVSVNGVYEQIIGSTWTNRNGIIRGEQGVQGIQGIQGEKGDQGNAGVQGVQGNTGAKGDKGDAFSTGTTATLSSGVGDPEGVITAYRGSIFMRTDGGTDTTIYVKETGDNTNTGWMAK
jgi:hypothetical protein